jgi:integrase/recombinase XerD
MGKLQEQMKADLMLKGYSPNTLAGYLPRCRKFAEHFNRSPEEMGQEEVRTFLLYLAQERKITPGSQKAYLSALKFLYCYTLNRPEEVENIPNPKLPVQLPMVLSREEVLAIFEAIPYIKHKAMIATTYGAGLRISEVCALRKSDIDSQRMRIYVHLGKGKKDRYALLSPMVLELLREYYRKVSPKGDWLFPGQNPQKHLTTNCIEPSKGPSRKWGSTRRRACTPYAIPSPRTCWRTVRISVMCRPFSATPPSAPRSVISMSLTPTSPT